MILSFKNKTCAGTKNLLIISLPFNSIAEKRRHDIQPNDTLHNDTLHNVTNDTLHNDTLHNDTLHNDT